MRRINRGIILSGVLAMAGVVAGSSGCTDAGNGTSDGGIHVNGMIIDFQTGQPVAASVSLSTQGISPAPVVTTSGAAYQLAAVQPNSVFYVLAGAPPEYRATFSDAIDVAGSDLDGVDVGVMPEPYLLDLSSGFGVNPTAAKGILFAQAVDDGGHGLAGVPASAFVPPDGALGPYFLADDMTAAPNATATSSSGWVVFFEVSPGLVGLTADAQSGVTMDMPVSPVAPASATIATLHVTNGAPILPKGVSFGNDIVPIFEARGCQSCHSGSGPGRDLGGLTLDGSKKLIYKELTQEASFTSSLPRVNLQAPEQSLVLTMPSAEDPPDAHPTIVFASPSDPDYLTILVWIREGAKQN